MMSVSLIAIISLGAPAYGFVSPYRPAAYFPEPVYAADYDPFYDEPYYEEEIYEEPVFDPYYDDSYYEEPYYEEAYYEPDPYYRSGSRTDVGDVLLLLLGVGLLSKVLDADVDFVVGPSYGYRPYPRYVTYSRPYYVRPYYVYDPWYPAPVRYVDPYYCPPPRFVEYRYEPHFYCGSEPVYIAPRIYDRSYSTWEPRYAPVSYSEPVFASVWNDRDDASWDRKLRRARQQEDFGYDFQPSHQNFARLSREQKAYASGISENDSWRKLERREGRQQVASKGGFEKGLSLASARTNRKGEVSSFRSRPDATYSVRSIREKTGSVRLDSPKFERRGTDRVKHNNPSIERMLDRQPHPQKVRGSSKERPQVQRRSQLQGRGSAKQIERRSFGEAPASSKAHRAPRQQTIRRPQSSLRKDSSNGNGHGRGRGFEIMPRFERRLQPKQRFERPQQRFEERQRPQRQPQEQRFERRRPQMQRFEQRQRPQQQQRFERRQAPQQRFEPQHQPQQRFEQRQRPQQQQGFERRQAPQQRFEPRHQPQQRFERQRPQQQQRFERRQAPQQSPRGGGGGNGRGRGKKG